MSGTSASPPTGWWAVPRLYRQIITPGDAVTFNDVGSGIVSLNTNVSSASLVISNVTSGYRSAAAAISRFDGPSNSGSVR